NRSASGVFNLPTTAKIASNRWRRSTISFSDFDLFGTVSLQSSDHTSTLEGHHQILRRIPRLLKKLTLIMGIDFFVGINPDATCRQCQRADYLLQKGISRMIRSYRLQGYIGDI